MPALPVRLQIHNSGDIRSWQLTRRVWWAIEQHPRATFHEIGDIADIPRESVKLHIARLRGLRILAQRPKKSGRTLALLVPYAAQSYLDEEEPHAD